MGKVRRVSVKLTKPTLKTNIIKRKSLKHSTPIPKKLAVKYVKQELQSKSPEKPQESVKSEDSSEFESDTSVDIKTEGQSVKLSNKIDRDQINSGVQALFNYILKTTENKIKLFDNEQPIFMQITAVKVPKSPNRQIRLLLKHSLLSEDSEICMIVQDIGKSKDYDATIEHYEKLLIDNDITKIKTILPYHQFKSEYGNQFELKRKLLGLYDYFLVDGRIAGYVAQTLGKIFLEKRKMPTSINLEVSNLKDHVEKALKKTIMKMHSKGDSYLVQIGHSKMKEEEVFDNICEIIDGLSDVFPGSLDNIRQLGLKTAQGFTVPIYLTLKNQNMINVTVVRPKRPKQFKDVTGELSTYLKKDVTVLPGGGVHLINKNENIASDDEDDEEDEEVVESADSDMLDGSERDLDLFDDNEKNKSQSDIFDSDNDNDSKGITETNKKGKGEKQQIQLQDQNESEEDELIEAEQIYLNEYEQKKINTTKQRPVAKITTDKSEIPTSSKVGNTSKKQKDTKNQVNKNEELVQSDEENEDPGKHALRARTHQIQISKPGVKVDNKKKVIYDQGEELSAKAITKKPKNIKVNNSKKKIALETLENEEASKNQSNQTGRTRKKRNIDSTENIPPQRSKKIAVEQSDVAEDQVPKQKRMKPTQASKKGKTDPEDENEANIKQTKKSEKGKLKKNKVENDTNNAQNTVKLDKNDVNSTVTNKVTKRTRNKKIEENTDTENKRPTRKQQTKDTDDTAIASKQKIMQTKKQDETDTVDAPVAKSAQKGRKKKANNIVNEIPDKKSKKTNEDQQEKSGAVPKEKSKKNIKKDEVKTNENKKPRKGQKVKK